MTPELLVVVVVVVCLGYIVVAVAVAGVRDSDEGHGAEPRVSSTDERRRAEPRARLESATNVWTKPVVMRRYESNERGTVAFERDAAILLAQGYNIQSQGAEGSHIHAGRLLLTGGLSVLAGRRGIRSKGLITVTFLKATTDSQT